MSKNEEQYLNLAKHILENGEDKSDRTGTGTKSIFGAQMRFDLNEGFPILTTKKVYFNLIKSELLWFLKGDTNIRYLLEQNNHIWDEWPFKRWVESSEYIGPDMQNFGLRCQTDEKFNQEYQEQKQIFCQKILTDDAFAERFGKIGDVYGKLWRSWPTTNNATLDQVQNIIDEIKVNPDSRRLILTAWNPETTPHAALPSCHVMSQFYVSNNRLSLQLYQRSGDFFLGIPFNIASYSLLAHMIAKECNLELGEFIHTIGDAHIYNNHIKQVKEQLARPMHDLPKLWLNPDINSVFDYEMDDIKLIDYVSEGPIKAPVAV